MTDFETMQLSLFGGVVDPESGGQMDHEPQLYTAMVTPFEIDPATQEHRVNVANSVRLAGYLASNGSDGLVINGTTGESGAVSQEEVLEVVSAVRDELRTDTKIIVGIGGMLTSRAVKFTENVAEQGFADGVLAVVPPYVRPSQFGILNYFRQIAAVGIPVTAYDIPVRTGRAASEGTLSTLVDEGAITSIKDANDSTRKAEALVRRFGEGVKIFSGNDALNSDFAFALRKIGHGNAFGGAISVASHYAGRRVKELLLASIDPDRVDEAINMDWDLANAWRFESTHPCADSEGIHDTPNPLPTKYMMNLIMEDAFFMGPFVSPMLLAPEEAAYIQEEAKRVYAKYQ